MANSEKYNIDLVGVSSVNIANPKAGPTTGMGPDKKGKGGSKDPKGGYKGSKAQKGGAPKLAPKKAEPVKPKDPPKGKPKDDKGGKGGKP